MQQHIKNQKEQAQKLISEIEKDLFIVQNPPKTKNIFTSMTSSKLGNRRCLKVPFLNTTETTEESDRKEELRKITEELNRVKGIFQELYFRKTLTSEPTYPGTTGMLGYCFLNLISN